MINFSGKTVQGERINFGFNNIRHIVKEDDLVILDRPDYIFVKLSTIEVEKYGKEIRGSNYPISTRLGYH
jgi:hypothetical protein